MIDKLEKLIERLNGVDLVGYARQDCIDDEAEFCDRIRYQMEELGVMPDSTPIHRLGYPDSYIYAPRTIAHKIRTGQRIDHVTLRDTGRYHSSITMQNDSDGMWFVSSDFKAESLRAYYGETLSLTDDYLNLYITTTLKDNLLSQIKTELLYG